MAIVVGYQKETEEERKAYLEDFDRRLAEQLKREEEMFALMTPEELEAAERGSISLAEKMQAQGW